MARRKRSRAPYMEPMVVHMHWNGKSLLSWLITRTKVRTDKDGKEYTVEVEEKRHQGHLIVMKTDCTGQRTLIEQSGHPIPELLIGTLDARVKHLKQAA